jgi:hypothetical protein
MRQKITELFELNAELDEPVKPKQKIKSNLKLNFSPDPITLPDFRVPQPGCARSLITYPKYFLVYSWLPF